MVTWGAISLFPIFAPWQLNCLVPVRPDGNMECHVYFALSHFRPMANRPILVRPDGNMGSHFALSHFRPRAIKLPYASSPRW